MDRRDADGSRLLQRVRESKYTLVAGAIPRRVDSTCLFTLVPVVNDGGGFSLFETFSVCG